MSAHQKSVQGIKAEDIIAERRNIISQFVFKHDNNDSCYFNLRVFLNLVYATIF